MRPFLFLLHNWLRRFQAVLKISNELPISSVVESITSIRHGDLQYGSARSDAAASARSAKEDAKGAARSAKDEAKGAARSAKDEAKGAARSAKDEAKGAANAVTDNVKTAYR